MALKFSKLSRLFNFEQKAEDEGKQEDVLLTKEEEDVPSVTDPLCLQLPHEHALNQLWRLRSEEKGWLPAPVLRLEGMGTQHSVLPEEQIPKELERLLKMVTFTAEARLALARPEPEPEGEKDSERSDTSDEADIREKSDPDLDAMAEVFLSEGAMTAWLLIYPPVGKGREVDKVQLENVLYENKVMFGVDDALLERLPEEKERYFHLFLAAQGKLPNHGKDGEIEDLYPRSEKREALVDAFGNVNYAELDFVHNINEGDTICNIAQPIEGRTGRTVTDQSIPPKEGKRVSIPRGRNTKVTEDGSRLIATKTGHVEFSGQGFQVKPVLEILGNVDYSTGNIDFLGDVHISGNVCAGFIVRATGSITVDGLLETCIVEAGGDLIVRRGIKGDQETIIRAGRGLYAKYLENATVCAKERLESDCIINCNVYSNGEVQVSSGRGILLGGIMRAACEVKANIVGSRSEHPTLICLGGLPSEEFELQCLEQEIKELEIQYEKLERQPDSPAKAGKMGMTRMKLSVNRKKQEQFAKYLEEAEKDVLKQEEEQEEEQKQDSRRLVCGIAYGGTEIRIGDAVVSLNREIRPCTAVLRKHEICFI